MTSTTLRRLLSAVLLGLTGLVVAAPLGGPAALTVVQGQSMEPTYVEGDLLLTWRDTSPAVGEIYVFDIGPVNVVHRVHAPGPDGTWVTHGDNNAAPDPWLLADDALRQRSVLRVPGVGGALFAVQRVLGDSAVAALVLWALFLVVRTVGPWGKGHHDPLLDLIGSTRRRLVGEPVASEA